MKLKKNIFSFILAICLIVPAMFALTACGENNPPAPDPEATVISEHGRTYTVANAETDVTIDWANQEEQELFNNVYRPENQYKADVATSTVAFNHKGQITFDLHNEVDATKYYTIGENNKLSFYEEKEHTTRLTDSQFAYDYQFNNTKDKLTITFTLPTCEHSTIAITLTAGQEWLDVGANYNLDQGEEEFSWDEAELEAYKLTHDTQNQSDVEDIEFYYSGGMSINVLSENKLLLLSVTRYYEIAEDGTTINMYKDEADFGTKTKMAGVTCTINAERTKITITTPINACENGFTNEAPSISTVTAIYILAD